MLDTHIEKIKKILITHWIFISLIWCLWVLFPLLNTGFISDDAYNSQVRGRLLLDGISLWERISSESLGWLKGAGRFNPVNWGYIYGLYFLTTNVLLIKLLSLLFIGISILLFSQIAFLFTGDKLLRLVISISIPTIIQFRLWHDPVVAFSAIIPIIAVLCFTSVLFYEKAITKNSYKFLAAALFFYATAILTYELSYFMFPIFCLMFLLKSKTRVALTGIIGLFILLAGHFLFTRLLMDANSSYPSLIPRLDPTYFFKAAFYQISAGFPLTWKLALNVPHARTFPLVGYQSYVFLLFSVVISLLIYKWDFLYKLKDKLFVLALAFILIFLGALPAIISGHQVDIAKAGLGFGYIVVYVQYFGVALLLLFFIKFIMNLLGERKILKGVLATFLGLMIGLSGVITRNENTFVAKELTWPYKAPRDFLESVINSGLLNNLTENDLLIRNYMVPSDNEWFMAQTINRPLNVCTANIEHNYLPCIDKFLQKNPTGNFYGLYYGFPAEGTPFAILAKIENTNGSNDFKDANIKFNKYFLFKNGQIETYQSDVPLNFGGILNLPMRLPKGYNFDHIKFSEFYKFPVAYEKFWGAEGDLNTVLRWSSGHSFLKVDNRSGRSVSVQLNFRLVRPDENLIQISMYESDKFLRKFEVNGAKEIIVPVRLKNGINDFTFKTNAEAIKNGDPRQIVFGLVNFKIIEVEK